MTRRQRQRVEELVHLLIAALDAHDGDPDIEPDADGEPSDNGIADLPSLLMIERVAA